MSLSVALKRFARCEIVFNLRDRGLNTDGFGGFVTPTKTDGTCTYKAFISYKELDKLNVSSDDAHAENIFTVYIRGKIDIQHNDTGTFDGQVFKVREFRYRPLGDFTKIIIKRIRHRGLTV